MMNPNKHTDSKNGYQRLTQSELESALKERPQNFPLHHFLVSEMYETLSDINSVTIISFNDSIDGHAETKEVRDIRFRKASATGLVSTPIGLYRLCFNRKTLEAYYQLVK